MKNETRVDTRYVCCATCKFWTGIVDFIYPSTVITIKIKILMVDVIKHSIQVKPEHLLVVKIGKLNIIKR